MPSSDADCTVLVDGMNSAYRAYYAYRDLHDSDNRPTSVIYGVLRELLMLRTRFKTPNLIVLWDAYSWRKDKSTALSRYKEARVRDQKTAEEMTVQVRALEDFLPQVGIGSFRCTGLEADDLVALTAPLLAQRGKVYVYSSDKDLYQVMVHKDVYIAAPASGKVQIVTPTDVRKRFGVSVNLWPHYLAAGGDTSDGYKAFAGVGGKTAAKLVGLGLRGNLPLAAQPAEVTSALQRPQEQWNELNTIYTWAKLPSTLTSKYLPRALRSNARAVVDAVCSFHTRRPSSKDRQLRAVTEFLADYELVTLLVKRRQFVNDPTEAK